MSSQLKTPLYDALIKHVKKRTISFHVPGHKSGRITDSKAKFLQQALEMDLTELSGLDDLHEPVGPIQEAQTLLAELYQAPKSYFLVNGSTVGNLAMIMAACHENDTVLVQRNCHKSVLNAIKLAKARPIFLAPGYDKELKAAGGVHFETVKQAINQYPEAKALILTYPNYYGMVYGLKEIIDEAHRQQIPVLVDEAHGPHFIIGGPFPASAVTLGADIVVQSAHKTLPAMTMGSFLHYNSSFINQNILEDYLHILQSSSPSYPIMASLDMARHYLAGYTMDDVQYLVKEIRAFKSELGEIPGIKVVGNGDPLKVTVQSQCGLSGFELQMKLEQVGIYTELADPNNVLFVLPLLKENQQYPLKDTALKISEILKDFPQINQREEIHSEPENISELAILYQEMDQYKQQTISIDAALDKISAETVIPYPPGIPLLLAGERVTKVKLQELHKLIKTGARFQGGAFLKEGFLNVFGGLKQ
jgi:arginine/lysine/ornithine decarboxylase